MLNPLASGDQSGVAQYTLFRCLPKLQNPLQERLSCRHKSGRLLAKDFADLLKTGYLALGLFEMIGEALLKFGSRYCLNDFGEGANDLFLSRI